MFSDGLTTAQAQDIQSMITANNQANVISGEMPLDYLANSTPVANGGSFGNGTYRGVGSKIFNQAKINAEDWERQNQLAQNDYMRNWSLQANAQSWNKMMSDTSYQRAVEDLEKAGLNPILAYSNGGASSPAVSGSSGSAGRIGSSQAFSNQIDNLLKFAGGLVSSASEYERRNTPVGFSERAKTDDSKKFGKIVLGALKAFLTK